MIIQALNSYYERQLNNPEFDIPKYGFGNRNISGTICLDQNGNIVAPYVKDIRTNDKKPQKISLTVPVRLSKRTSGIKPLFLWDKTEYLLGIGIKNKQLILTNEHFESSKELHRELLKGVDCIEAESILKFFEKWKPSLDLKYINDFASEFLVFQIDNHKNYIHQVPKICKCWYDYISCNPDDNQYVSPCLVTGKRDNISLLHPPIKGIKADKAELGIIAINKDKTAFCSYGKEQGYNSPIGTIATFNYVTALNLMLDRNSKQKIQISDSTIVFWTERNNPLEGIFGLAIDPNDAELADNNDVLEYLKAVKSGNVSKSIDNDVNFFILGLSPNGPRIAIRFWCVSKVDEINNHLGQHFMDLEMVKQYSTDSEFPGLSRILGETVHKKNKDKTPAPLLAGALTRSILQGTLYPQILLSKIIERVKAECALKEKSGKPVNNVDYIRAAILKAILNRKSRILNRKELEVTMALDVENKQPAYLLGRLFAVLEKAQKDAIPGANSTIKDRYYGAASATPRVVFPQLLRLSQHHINKSDYGFINDKRIEEIMADIQEFPAHLTIDEQGLFAIGYYHQRQSLFPTKEK